ncbi:Glycine--tRNA ligase [Spiroplasma sp. JKS002671]|nr:glycine--tRNA ligase [Spiroplasma sp. JKS002671]MCL8210784.1 Glycine--tRNA ligase [Spiroplasma sp. JKS002671]
MQAKTVFSMKEIINHLKEFGFVFQGSEIYGGLANTWDYGHLGVILKHKIKLLWWNHFIKNNQFNIALDSSILLNSKVWQASGHLDNFNDPLVDCKNCKFRFRADTLIQHYFPDLDCDGWSNEKLDQFIVEKKIKCLNCQHSDFTKVKQFRLMFETYQGSVENQGNKLYLRPETAQGIFINFNNMKKFYNKKLPFGIGQIGKSFRNEITPGNFIFRTYEFEQMELEFFYSPTDSINWFNYWLKSMQDFIKKLGISEHNCQLHQHDKDKLSHYSLATTDILYKFPFGWKELSGIANRGNYDLMQHAKASKANFLAQDSTTNKLVNPLVIEPSIGVERLFFAIICDSLIQEKVKDKSRTVLKLNSFLAPYHVAIASLNKKKLGSKAQAVFALLQPTLLDVVFDQKSEIGKVYNYHDQIGTLYCVTVDYQTLEDEAVTVRNRDDMGQVRVKITELKKYLYQKLNISC